MESKEDFNIPSDKELALKLAFEYKAQNRIEESVKEFQKVLNYFEEEPNVVLMVAMLLVLELKDYDSALPYAKRAVELQPKLEKASLILFHCYFDQGLQDEAEEEISRFVKTGAEINQYQVLFDENNVSVDDFR